MLFKCVEALAPRVAVRGQPVVQIAQWLGAQSIDPALRLRHYLDEPRRTQGAQVFRHARLAGTERRDQVTDIVFAGTQQVEQPATARFGEGFHRRLHKLIIPQEVYNCQGMDAVFGLLVAESVVNRYQSDTIERWQ